MVLGVFVEVLSWVMWVMWVHQKGSSFGIFFKSQAFDVK